MSLPHLMAGCEGAGAPIACDVPIDQWIARASDHVRDVTRSDAVVLGHPLSQWRQRVREELGVDASGPVIATGHQPGIHHPGILVKSLIVSELSAHGGVGAFDLVVDTDVIDFGSAVAYPAEDEEGTLLRVSVPFEPVCADVPAFVHPAVALVEGATSVEPVPLPGSVDDGVSAVLHALHEAQHLPNAAAQFTQALDRLRAEFVRPLPRPLASRLLQTSLGSALLQEMARDPWRCAEAFNAALRDVPGTGMRPLLITDEIAELPIWRTRRVPRSPHPVRERAFDGDAVRAVDDPEHRSRLHPRALLLTAIMRLGACDLFVHGKGGHAYDRAMEVWLQRWLGVSPAPSVMASVTRMLEFPGRTAETPGRARRTHQEARRAWHDPESWSDERSHADFGSGAPGATKRMLLEAIQVLPRKSRRRRDAFMQMHRQLAMMRSLHVGAVERRARLAREARQRVSESAVISARDWPFPLYGDAVIRRLAQDVRACLGR